ncbi:MAG: site-specific integrase [Ignavibacteriaceae bacterium]
MEIISGNFNIPINTDRDFLKFYKSVIDNYPKIEKRTTTYKHLVDYTTKNGKKTLYFSDVNENLWNKFKTYLKDEVGHAPYTIFIEFGTLKTVLNKAIRAKMIFNNPLGYIKEHKPKTNRTYLTWEELQRLYNIPCAFVVVKNAFFFSCFTGLRISDINALKKKYFWEDKIVFPAMEKTEDAIAIDYEKSTLEYIPNFSELKPDDPVFKLPAKSIVHTYIKQWVSSAGITKNVSYHTSRHTFATGLLTYNNGDIATAKELLGN